MKIYVTYCSAKKDDLLKNTGKKVTPDRLYTSERIQRFIKRCKEKHVNWAIFSDLHGVWFPQIRHEWYEKAPDMVTGKEFRKLLADFDEKLAPYDEVWFYCNPGRFHPLYKRLLQETKLKERVRLFTHVKEIK